MYGIQSQLITEIQVLEKEHKTNPYFNLLED